MCEPVGVQEIAERLGRSRSTVSAWARDGFLPAPAGTVSGRPAWSWASIEEWVVAGGMPSSSAEPPAARWRRPRPGSRFEEAGYATVVTACSTAGGWASIADAAAALELNHHTAARALERCAELGLVERVEGGRGFGYRPLAAIAQGSGSSSPP